MERLLNKVILITGATSQIALAFAKIALSESPKALILTGIDDEKGEAFAKSLGKKCIYLHLDVTQPGDWKKVVSFIKNKFGSLNVLVNNASITGTTLQPPALGLDNATLDSWREVIQTDLDSIFLACNYLIPLMQASGPGTIVNIGSRSGLVGRPDRMAYAAAKAAAINLTKSIAIYCTDQGFDIRCNIVLPSTILTEMWEPILGDKEHFNDNLFQEIAGRVPLKRFGKPKEVAKVILFLASEESSYITGSEIIVDGGVQARDVLRG